MMEALLFAVFAFVAIASAILMVAFRNPVHSALALVTTFFALAGLFALLQAHFLAAVQIIVYAGAIMVLFLFVIMLLNLGHPESLEPMPRRVRRLTVLLLMALLAGQIGLIGARGLRGSAASVDSALFQDNVSVIGRLLYTDYLFAIQVVGMILLVALVGVMVLVKKDKPAPSTAGE
jgi:NADH-quinone oxidoreductase subunit J